MPENEIYTFGEKKINFPELDQLHIWYFKAKRGY